jgi:tetratricopeptide (TPR) repeat protein
MKKAITVIVLLSALAAGQAFGSSYDDLNAGIKFHNRKQWSDSIEAFDKALATDDLSSDQKFIAHMDRALANQELGLYDLALADYSACLLLEPNNATALLERANIYLANDKLSDAAHDLDALIAERPMLASAYTMRAAIDAKLGKVDQGLTDSKRALSLLPDNYARSIRTGIIAWQAGQIRVANDNFSYAISQGRTGIFAWLWHALATIRMGAAVPKQDLPNYDTKNWPAPIVAYFIGNAGRDAVFAAAGEGEDAVTRGKICEANFYVGEWLLQHHDLAGARPMIQKAATDCPTNFEEWSPAQMELAGFTR